MRYGTRVADQGEAAQQQLHRDMRQRAVSGGCVIELAGIGFRVGKEASEIPERRVRMADQKLRRLGHQGDGAEILLGVVGQARLQHQQLIDNDWARL